MLPYRNILLAIACAEGDRALLAYAAMLAGMASEAVFRLVHVLPTDSDAAEREAHAVLADLTPALGFAAHSASSSVLRGDRLDALLQFAAAEHTDLILLGHRRARSGRRSLARRLAMKAHCSVWLVPEGCPPQLQRVLAPVDFSRYSAESLEIATRIAAAARRARCYALHVRFNDAVVTFDEYENVEIAGEQEAFSRFIAPLDLHGVYVEPVFAESPRIAATIRRVASEKECDLIVMGTRGRSRAAAVLLGSETEQTIIETTIPLVAVRHDGPRLRLLDVLLEQRFRNRGDLHFG